MTRIYAIGAVLAITLLALSAASAASADGSKFGLECLACQEVVFHLQLTLKGSVTPGEVDFLQTVATEVCMYGWSSGTVNTEVCSGLVEEFTSDVIYILAQSIMSPEDVCVYLKKCPYEEKKPWFVKVPGNKPAPKIPHVVLGEPTRRILHISDIHYDPLYAPNRTTSCGEPVCCRSDNGPAKNSQDASGRWGDYRYCDTSPETFETMMQKIASMPPFDFIIFTGDSPVHAVWETTPEGNLGIANTTYSLMKKYLPNVPFFGAIGNHEFSPVNMDPPPGVLAGPNGVQWLYDGLAHIWSDLNDGASTQLRYAGYYAQELDNLTIVSLNMNFGDPENWWTLADDAYLGAQEMLRWLVGVLREAESRNRKAMIIGHQPPDRMNPSFFRNYVEIIWRFENTIVAQYFGHSHKDEFLVFVENSTITAAQKRAFGIAYIGPSVTPYSFMNYGFRVYLMNARTNYLVDSFTNIFNLTRANMLPHSDAYPLWYLEYNAKHAYKFNGTLMVPQDWANLVTRMYYDDELWSRFITYKSKSSDIVEECDATCRSTTLSGLVIYAPSEVV